MNTKQKEKDIEALRERIYRFVVQVVNLVKELPPTLIGNRIGGQLLDAATSIGANFEEAQAAVSFADFTYKLATAKKEAYETHYWLRVIRDTHLLPQKRLEALIQEALELKKILTSGVKTAQENPDDIRQS